MLRNYITIAWRSIEKHRFFSVLNIAGLSIGIAFVFLIAADVWKEMQVNQSLKNADQQYIIQSKWKDPNMGGALTTLGPLAKMLHDQYPNLVANYYRWDGITSNVSYGDKHFREGLQVSDSTLLDMYGFQLLYGNAKNALTDPFSVVITEAKALKFFGRTDVLGKTLNIESFGGGKHDFIISGVLKETPDNSVTHVDANNDNQIFLPVGSAIFFGRNFDPWTNIYIISYVELKKGVTPKDLEKPIRQLVKANAPPIIADNIEPYLVSLNNYYLDAGNGLVKKMLYTLSFIAGFILLMAMINFVNLSISKSSARMREIGIRKVLGGLKKQLVIQFLTESILLVCLATFVALILYSLSKEYIGHLLNRRLPALTTFPAYFIFIPIIFILFAGMLAGFYPAWVLSSLKSVDSLKGKLPGVKENILFRKTLVGFQFATAVIVFVGAIIISEQVSYFFGKSLGYNKDFIVSAQVPRDWSPQGVQHMEMIRKQFEDLAQLDHASLSYEIPNGNNGGSILIYKAASDSTQSISADLLSTDEQYAATYQIPVLGGSFFNSPNQAFDSANVVINETAARALGFNDPQKAIGTRAKIQGYGPMIFTIYGVTKDFHFGSMQGKIQPLAFLHVKLTTGYRFLSFKMKPGNIASNIEALQKKWAQLIPGAPFEFLFMDQNLQKMYQSELQLKQASYTATILSFTIVLLGVVGLIVISIQKRTREIGIRKVLGAPVLSIIYLFLKEFILIIFLSSIVAFPAAYYIMQNWLNDYFYRVPITPSPFIFALTALAIITSPLIIFQTMRAALANPVSSLKTE